MPIADEKVKTSTHRVTLVQLDPVRDLTSLLVDIGGGVYAYTFPDGFEVFEAHYNDTEMTRVFVTPTVDYQFQFDDATGYFAVKLPSAPQTSLPVRMVTATYRIYLKDNETYERELDNYHNRITDAPRFRQSVSNSLGGVVTIAKQNLGVENSDLWFSKYLTENDYYFNKNISVSFRLNNVEIAGFVGKLGDYRMREGSLSFEVLDSFLGLKDTATMGDTLLESYNRSSGVYYKDFDKPTPYFFKSSNFAWSIGRGIVSSDPANYPTYWIDISKMERAVCTDFDYTISTSTNRTWRLGRGPERKSYNFGTITDIALRPSSTVEVEFPYLNYPNRGILEFFIAGNHNIEIGDCFTIENNSSILHQMIVFHVYDDGFLAAGTQVAPLSGETWTGNPITQVNSPCVIVKQLSDGKEFFCQEGYDFTVIETTTQGGNKSWSIQFNNNFENNATHNGLMNPLSPETHEIYFRITTTQDPHNEGLGTPNHKINSVLERIYGSIGLVHDAGTSTITDYPCMFSIPFFGQSDYGSYLDYLEPLLASVPAYSFVSAETGQVITKRLGQYVGNDERSDDDIYTISTSFDSSECYTQVIIRPKYAHRTYSPNLYADYESQLESVSWYYAQYKYRMGIEKTKLVNSLFDNGFSTSAASIAAPAYKVRYNIGMQEIDSTIGNGRVLTSKFAIGKNTTINGNDGIQTVITAIDIGTDSIQVEAITLKG